MIRGLGGYTASASASVTPLIHVCSRLHLVDLVKGRLTRLETLSAASPPAGGPSVDAGAAPAEARTAHGAPVGGFPLGGGTAPSSAAASRASRSLPP